MTKIAIDAGHGRYTSGKRCMRAIDPNETREWVLNQRVAGYVVEHLTRCGASCKRLDDVTGETDINLHTRCAAANRWGADWCVSIHHDSGINGGAGGGPTVYVYNGSHSSKSDTLQANVMSAYWDAVGRFGNRYDNTLSADFCMVRETTMPAILIECGFMDSTVDTPMILTDSFARKAAQGIAKGICKTAGLAWTDDASVKNEEETYMTQEQFNQMFAVAMDHYLAQRNELPPSEWNADWDDITGTGITDGTMPQGFATREQVGNMVYRAMTK